MTPPAARTAEDLDQSPRWLTPILTAALVHRWTIQVTVTPNGHRDVTFTRGRDTVRIRGLRRANLTRWVVDGIELRDVFLADAPAVLADPDVFLHHDEQTAEAPG